MLTFFILTKLEFDRQKVTAAASALLAATVDLLAVEAFAVEHILGLSTLLDHRDRIQTHTLIWMI